MQSENMLTKFTPFVPQFTRHRRVVVVVVVVSGLWCNYTAIFHNVNPLQPMMGFFAGKLYFNSKGNDESVM